MNNLLEQIGPHDERLTNSGQVIISRAWSMPNRNTFKMEPVARFIDFHLTPGLWIDPFANENRIANITNDLDPAQPTDFHMDALAFLQQFSDASVDGVLFDPPYSPRQVSECYKAMGKTVNMQTTQAAYWGNLKKEIARILRVGGTVLTFGWNSGGIGRTLGFEKREMLMVAHGGWHNDTICVAEKKVGPEATSWRCYTNGWNCNAEGSDATEDTDAEWESFRACVGGHRPLEK